MKIFLVSRFYYTLPLICYFNFKVQKKSSLPFFKNSINFNNARTGLRLILSSLSKSSLKIGVQAYTCHTVFQAIKKAGHTPVFLDINNNFQLDLDDLKVKSKYIDVLIVTHTFGFPEQIDEIKEIVGDIVIIEDGAHAFLSKYKGKNVGELADAAIFSTGLGKYPAIGSGGFCLINNKDKFPYFDFEYNKLKPIGLIRSALSLFKTVLFSIIMKPPFYGAITFKLGKKFDSKFDFVDKFNFNEKLSMKWVNNIFRANYSEYKKSLKKQRLHADYLFSLLGSNIKVVTVNENSEPNFYAFPILVERRDQFYDDLLSNNIESGKHFHKSIIWAKEFGYKQGDCPQTEKIVNRVLTLPIHNGISINTIRKVAEIVNRYE